MEKKDLLKDVVEHIDIKKYDSTELINAMRKMSFTSRDTARAADILCQMIAEKDCTNILTIAGSTSAAGCMQVYVEMVRNKMVDAVVSTGASIIDMDLFEALGYKHLHRRGRAAGLRPSHLRCGRHLGVPSLQQPRVPL